MPIPEVDIIVVAKNQIAYTRQCIESIFKNVTTPFRILFVDNASNDETPVFLAEAAKSCPSHGKLEVLRNEENLGWTRGLNQGIRQTSAPLVIFSNNDIEVFPGAIEEMISVAKSDPQIGIVNPNSNEFSVKKKDAPETNSLAGQRIERFHAAGFFMLVKRPVLQNIGEMDEIFSPGYFEEMDYSERARKADFLCVTALGAYVYHYGTRSFLPEEKQRLWDKNEKIFEERWGRAKRIAYIGGGKDWEDPRAREVLSEKLLAVIREKRAYGYFYLPSGAKKILEALHVGFRVTEAPAGIRGLLLFFKVFRSSGRKKIQTIYFSERSHVALWQKLGAFLGVEIKKLPE